MRTIWALLLSIVMANAAYGDDTGVESNYIFQSDQVVQGNGFFSAYKDISTGQLAMDTESYGSGSYNYESMTKVQNNAKYDTRSYSYSALAEQKIKFDETVDFSYAPMNFDLGGSFEAALLKKLGKEETCVKNYADPISMNVLFDSASILSKNLSADLLASGIFYDDPINGLYQIETLSNQRGFTNLNVDAAFTGKGHVGVLEQQHSVLPNAKSQGVDQMIDEDYIGTFHLTKKMSQAFNKTTLYYYDDWLPCCNGGYADMNPLDARFFKSAKGIFDCTCYEAPTTAQFPRVY